jgi:GT2 family glycosyltransferase
MRRFQTNHVSTPQISVVIPTRERRDSVVRALQALARQDMAADEFEVVVSVDGASDGTAEAVVSFRSPYEVRVVEGARGGRAAACNAAINATRGDVVVILDDDMEPAPSCLRRHGAHHAVGTRVCVMGAVPIRLDSRASAAARYMAWKFELHLEKLGRPQHVFALRDFYSGNTSIRRDVLLEVGLFEEAFTLYGNEDLELSLRLRAANVSLLYDRDALAHQHYEKDLAQLARDTFEKGTTAVLLARSHPSTFAELQLATFGEHSLAWRAIRALLLSVTRVFGGVTAAVLAAARLLERTPIGRRPLFHIMLLDYFYWLGVESVLTEGSATGPLAQLAADLRDGPIGLLLHRQP